MEEEGARRGGRPELGPGGGRADLISALPEDLLLQVLVRLRCAAAAAAPASSPAGGAAFEPASPISTSAVSRSAPSYPRSPRSKPPPSPHGDHPLPTRLAPRLLAPAPARVQDVQRLELYLARQGHVFGAFVWHLLRMHHICTATQSLMIVLPNSEDKEACPVNCPFDKPRNWRSRLSP